MTFEQQSSLESLETQLTVEIARSDENANAIDNPNSSFTSNTQRAAIITATEMRIARLRKDIKREKKRIETMASQVPASGSTTERWQIPDPSDLPPGAHA